MVRSTCILRLNVGLDRFISLIIKRVRVAAAESMPLLLECARVRGPEYLTQMWHFMCDALIKAIGTEPDSDVLSEIMHSFAKVTLFLANYVAILLIAFQGTFLL